MATWDILKLSAKRAADAALKETGDAADLAALNIKKKTLEAKRNSEYEMLGRLTYRQLKTGVSQAERIAPVIEKLITSTHKYITRHLEITGADSDSEVAARIIELARSEKCDKNVSLKVYLEGSIPPTYTPNAAQIELLAGLSLCSLKLRDRTAPIFGSEYLEQDMSIKGELYRTLLPRLASPDEDERRIAADALRIGLLALEGRAFI